MRDYKVHRIRFVDFTPKTINAIAFYQNGKQSKLALARGDGSIEIRNPSSDWIVDYVIPGHDKRSVEHLAWCDGRLFSGSVSGHIIEWDLGQLQPKYHQDSYGGPVWCLKFSYSKKVLAAGCEDGGLHLFEVLKDSIMYKGCLSKQESRILCLGWSHDDQYIFTGGFDCSMHKCNVKTGQIVSRMTTENLKEQNTMVWSMEVLKDMTIVIGDSLGNTQFWDGRMCTLVQSFKSHLADVLAVAVDEQERTVYSTGIDSKITEFKLVLQQNHEKWVMTKPIRASNHDVRTLCICGEPYNCLISGGIDPRFIVCPLDKFNIGSFTLYSCLPKREICQLSRSANLLLFRDQHSLHIWKLSSDNEINSPKQNKMFQIKSDRTDHLICSAISDSGSYAAYSNINKGQLFELNTDILAPSVQKCAVSIPPSTHMCFLHKGDELLTVGHQHNVNIININEGLIDTIQFPENISPKLPYKFLSVSFSDSYACVVDSISNAFIFSITDRKYITSLPRIDEVTLGCTFSRKNDNLFIITCSKHLYEYNIDTEKFELWCLDLNKSEVIASMGDKKDKANIIINPLFPEEIFIQEERVFGKIIHGTEIPPDITDGEEEIERKKGEVIKTNSQYKSIMFFDFNSAGEVVLVEQSIEKILGTLPAPLKRKLFGS